jgi:hypothetical protein
VLVDERLVRVRASATGYSSRWPHVVAYQILSMEKLQRLAPEKWQPLLRRQRARHGIALAREYQARHDGPAALRTLRQNLPVSWRYPETWLGSMQALLNL